VKWIPVNPQPAWAARAGISARWGALCVTLWLSLAGAAFCAAQANQTPSLPDLPRLALDGKRDTVRVAIQEAYNAAQAHPLDASANGKLGMVLHAHNFFEEAEVCYQRAHLLEPTSFRWAYYLGLVHLGRANCNAAASAFRHALRLDVDYLPAKLRLGQCLRGPTDLEEARQLYEAVVQKYPENAHAYYGLGRVYAAQNDLSRAAEMFRKACALFPEFGPAHYALAQAYQRLKKTDLAEEQRRLFKKNETAYPLLEDPLLDDVRALYRDYDAYLTTGRLLGGKGKLEEALAAYEEALEINPELPDAHARLVYLYGQMGQFAKAEEHYRTAIRLNPNTAEAYFNYGSLILGQGRSREAEEAFRKAVEINPRYAEAQNSLGYVLEGQGKLPEATAEFRKALESKPEFPQAHFNLGRILVKQDNYEEGIPHLLKALATDDDQIKTSYLHAIGTAYASLGDLENAVLWMRLARQKAAAQNMAKLVQTIDEDLRLLEGTPGPP